MNPAIIEHFLDEGWQQSHSETPNGCIFERREGDKLVIIVVNAGGLRLDTIRMGRFAIDRGVAGAVVNKLYESLNKSLNNE